MANDSLYRNASLYKRGLYEYITYYDRQSNEIVRLHPKQVQALKYFNDPDVKYVGYGGSARGGKTVLGDLALLLECYAYPGTRYLIARKELKNLLQTSWKTMLRLFSNFDMESGVDFTHNQQQHEVKFHETGSEIILYDAQHRPSDQDITRLGSMELTKAFIDQSEQVSLAVVEKVGERVGTHMNLKYNLKGKVLEGFNPSQTHVYRRYYKPWRDGTETENRRFVRALPADNPGAEARRWVAEKIQDYQAGDMSEIEYQRQILGNFEYDTDPKILFEHEAVWDMFSNAHVLPDAQSRYVTADIAMHGSDRFVVFVWYGWVVVDIAVVPKSGGRQVVDEIRRMMAKHAVYGSNVVYDSDGVGAFVGGQGGFIPGAKPFRGGAAPFKMGGKRENYGNLRAQCGYTLPAKFRKREIRVLDEAIENAVKGMAARVRRGGGKNDAPSFHELQTIIADDLKAIKKRDELQEGKLFLKKKKDIVQDLGRSPDFGDNFLIRQCTELMPKPKPRQSARV